MSSITTNGIKSEFLKSKLGLTGVFILFILILASIITITVIPASTFQEWNNPEKWISYPKTSVPSWVNFISSEKIPEHKIINADIFQSQNEKNQISFCFIIFDFNYFEAIQAAIFYKKNASEMFKSSLIMFLGLLVSCDQN